MNNHIYIYKKALSSIQCKALVELFEKKNKKYRGPMNSYCKKNDIYFYDFIELEFKTSIFSNILAAHLFKYKFIHKFLGSREKMWGPSPKCNLQRFLPGNSYYIEHCEHESERNSSLRILGWMFYLNDIEEDGETFFPQQNIKIKPEVGKLCIWPAGWTHSHYGISAKKELKYIVTGWCQYL